jgi:hypothetical protein
MAQEYLLFGINYHQAMNSTMSNIDNVKVIDSAMYDPNLLTKL